MLHEIIKIEQSNEINLIQKYSELRRNYQKLKDMANEVYNENVSNEKYKDKLLYKVDTISINETHKVFYTRYEANKNDAIEAYLKKPYNLNEEKVSKIFELRQKMLINRMNDLDVKNIGLVLNVAREFYNDVLVDLKRSKIEFGERKKRNDRKMLAYSLDMDSNKYEQTIQFEMRE